MDLTPGASHSRSSIPRLVPGPRAQEGLKKREWWSSVTTGPVLATESPGPSPPLRHRAPDTSARPQRRLEREQVSCEFAPAEVVEQLGAPLGSPFVPVPPSVSGGWTVPTSKRVHSETHDFKILFKSSGLKCTIKVDFGGGHIPTATQRPRTTSDTRIGAPNHLTSTVGAHSKETCTRSSLLWDRAGARGRRGGLGPGVAVSFIRCENRVSGVGRPPTPLLQSVLDKLPSEQSRGRAERPEEAGFASTVSRALSEVQPPPHWHAPYVSLPEDRWLGGDTPSPAPPPFPGPLCPSVLHALSAAGHHRTLLPPLSHP